MNILLPVDGSPESAAAVQAVATRPWPRGSNLRILSVIQNVGPPPVGEFMVPAATGENEIAYCEGCGYAANVDKATSGVQSPKSKVQSQGAMSFSESLDRLPRTRRRIWRVY